MSVPDDKPISEQGDSRTLANGKDEEHNLPPLRRSALRALVQDFGPLW